MKRVSYKLYFGDPKSDDPERAVLPTIIYARRSNDIATSYCLAIGWWAWGIGIIRTVIDVRNLQS